ncbi:MAG: efflux RND transporter periplasmic adaptor subunit [Cyanobacteria bacterium J06638_20]
MCSIPSRQSGSWRVRPWMGLPVATTLLLSACGGGPPMMQGQPPVPVELQDVTTSTVEEFSEFVGVLEAQDRVALRPEISGRVVQVFVEPGQRVEAGTPIARLRADQSRAELSGATADVEASIASVNTAEARVRAAEAAQARSAADLELENTELARAQSLVSEGALPQQDLDRARNRQQTAAAALRVAEEDVGAARAALTEAQARLNRSRADQDIAREDLQDSEVVAPIGGLVGDIPVQIGDFVSSNDVLTSIIQNDVLELNLAVPIERSPELRQGLPVELIGEAGEAVARGQVSFISPEVDAGQQSVLAQAQFQNSGVLRDGQFVRTRVIWSSAPGVLVPTDAVTRIAGETFVFVAGTPDQCPQEGQGAVPPGPPGAPEGEGPSQIALQRPVTLGILQGNDYQVVSGVEVDEQVVVSGVINLQNCSPILLQQAMGQPES